MLVTQHPPHRSVLAELPHTAPTSSIWRQSKLLWRPRSSPIDAKSRLCIRFAASCTKFLLVDVLSSIDSAETAVPLFADFPGNMLPSDSSGETTTGVRLVTFPVASAVATSEPRSSFPRSPDSRSKSCPHMPGSLTPPEHDTTRLSRCPVLPSHQSTSSASGKRCFRSSIARLCLPLSTLPHALAGRRGMTRSSDGSLFLSDKTLSFSTPRRF